MALLCLFAKQQQRHTAGFHATEVSTRRSVVGRTTCGLVFICGHAIGERTASCGRAGKAGTSHHTKVGNKRRRLFVRPLWDFCHRKRRQEAQVRSPCVSLTPGQNRSNKSFSLFAAVCTFSLAFPRAKRSYLPGSWRLWLSRCHGQNDERTDERAVSVARCNWGGVSLFGACLPSSSAT